MTDKELELNKRFLAKCCEKEYNDIRVDAVLLGASELSTCQQAEIERLKIENQSLRAAANSYKIHYNEARVEAVKEFAERLIEFYTDEDITDDMHCSIGVIKANIQDVLEEMIGDNQ